MDIKSQRRIASEVLNIGYHRVWVDPEKLDDVSLALTRDDIRKLVHDGIIKVRPDQGISKGRFRNRLKQKRRGQRKGHGSRSGTTNARLASKRLWINRVRAQRRYLKALRDTGQLESKYYREYYLKIKGGSFRSVAHLRNIITDAKILKKPSKKSVRR